MSVHCKNGSVQAFDLLARYFPQVHSVPVGHCIHVAERLAAARSDLRPGVGFPLGQSGQPLSIEPRNLAAAGGRPPGVAKSLMILKPASVWPFTSRHRLVVVPLDGRLDSACRMLARCGLQLHSKNVS